jgi:hypothetical protein
MKDKILIFLILFLLCNGCNSHNPIKIGMYKSVPFGRVEMGLKYLIYGLRGYYCGSKLIIKADSSFIYERSPYISSGIWYREQDSVVLVFKDCNYINDSIKFIYQKYNISPYNDKARKYFVGKHYLYREKKFKNNENVYEKLEFNAP